MGGCAKVRITCKKYGDMRLPSVFVYTDHPVIATLGSQCAGWQIKEADYFAIGSGPARALALKPKRIFEEIGYKDDFDKAAAVLETDKSPPDELVKRFAEDCGVPCENLAIILAPTASLSGAIQISGRIVETGIHKLARLGLNPDVILHAWGYAPIPPVHPRFADAMARSNDALLYGGVAYYVVDCDNEEELKKILKQAPSKASRNYGRPFIEIFKEAKNDFYRIDPDLFAPAVVIVNNVQTGRSFKAGEVNAGVLARSLGF
jgi:methenyltetrahydromethanopterin cyclohydrolase